MCNLLQDLINNNPNSTIWIAGDANLPNIGWINNCVSGNNYPSNFCTLLLDTFCDAGFAQIVTFPTRKGNTLNIFATNKPSIVHKCLPIPGIGDHDAVYVESLIRATYTCPIKRKIFLWNRADYCHLSEIIASFTDNFLDNSSVTTPVQDMWNVFKEMCYKCMNLIPYKYSSSRFNQPWVTSHTRRICRKKKRLYNRARATGSDSNWRSYYEYKKFVQTECRKTHNEYVSNLIDPESNCVNKTVLVLYKRSTTR